MRDHIVGRPLFLGPEFELMGLYLTPAGDIEVEVMTADGTVVHTYVLVLGSTGFILPSDHLTLDIMDLSKVFFLNIRFLSGTSPVEFTEPVRVIRFKPITVSADQIRQFLGASSEEVTDQSLDIYGSYLELSSLLGRDLFSDLSFLTKANRLLLLHVLLKQLPTLPIKLINSRAVDDHKTVRNKIDFDRLQGQLQNEYDSLLYTDFGLTSDLIEEPLLTVVSLTDPYSGQ